MAKLYREHVLGEDPNVIGVGEIASAKPVEEEEVEPVAGD